MKLKFRILRLPELSINCYNSEFETNVTLTGPGGVLQFLWDKFYLCSSDVIYSLKKLDQKQKRKL